MVAMAQHARHEGAPDPRPTRRSPGHRVRKAGEAKAASLEDFEIALSLYDLDDHNIDRCAELGVTVLYRDAFCDEKGMASKMTLEEKLRDMDVFASRNLVYARSPGGMTR
jgi:hypothetical protein